MRTFIKVSDPLRGKLIREFKVSRTTVWAALNYLTRGDRPDEIRRYALENGGSIEEKDFLPNCRTENTDEEIIQTFAGGIQVRISIKNSEARLLEDGREIEHYESMTLQAWGNLLYHAQCMSERRVKELSR